MLDAVAGMMFPDLIFTVVVFTLHRFHVITVDWPALSWLYSEEIQ